LGGVTTSVFYHLNCVSSQLTARLPVLQRVISRLSCVSSVVEPRSVRP
jgi:hypothetical protein